MNERIRELWRQAVLNNTKTPMNFQDAADEFAELIIKEVHYVIVVGGVQDLDIVLEHFGVEE